MNSLASISGGLVGTSAPSHNGLRLSSRIALTASALILSFLLIVGTASYQATRSHITRSQSSAVDHHAALVAGELGAMLSAVVSTLGTLAENTLILNSLMDSLTREMSLIPFLKDFSTVNGVAVEIALFDFEGKLVAGHADSIVTSAGWQRGVLEEGVPFATVQRDAVGVFLLVAQPMFYVRTPSPEGALVYRIALPQSIFNPDEDGDRVRLLQAGAPIMQEPRLQKGGCQDVPMMSRIRRLDLPPMLEHLDLAIEVLADPSAVDDTLAELFRIYALAGLIMVAVAIGLSAVVARRLIRPLSELEEVATKVVDSKSFDHRFDAGGAPEVGRLGDAFNGMLERLAVAYEQLSHEAALDSERRAELAETNIALQAEVTERKWAEADAEQAREVLAEAIDSLTDGFALFDKNRSLVLCNEQYRTMLPALSEELVPGADFEKLWETARERGQFLQVLDAENGEPLDSMTAWQSTVPVELLTREGRWLLARDRVTASGGRVGVSIDITERKHAEQAVVAHAKNLARSNEELEQFAYVASHDLQEPLRKVHSFSDLLEIDNASRLDDTGRQHLARIRTACRRMQTLIDDLLTFSRISRGDKGERPVDLNRVVEQVIVDLTLRLNESGGQVEVSPLPTVVGDPVHMGQLFQNLIGNALKYRRPGVAPMVRVCASVQDNGRDVIPGKELQPRLCEVSVFDNGIGFEQKYAERVFGVFQRLHGVGEYQGTGIGLAICRKIVERHGGTVRALSEPDAGTEIRFTLALAQAVAMRAAS